MNNRKKLLPTWIRFFCWIFLIFLGTPIVFIVGLLAGNMDYNVFGLAYYGPALNPLPIIMMLVLLIHGIAAYGLLWGRRWAVDAGIFCGVTGAIFSTIGIVTAQLKGQGHFEFSIIGQILFLLSLFKIRREWLGT